MATGFFGDIAPIRYEGATSENPLAYRFYDATRVVMGKTHRRASAPRGLLLAQFRLGRLRHVRRRHLRAPVVRRDDGGGAASRPTPRSSCSRCSACRSSPSTTATSPPKARASPSSARNLAEMADYFAGKIKDTGVKLLWGTANLFSHPPLHGGRRDQPRPRVFASPRCR